MTTNAPQAVNSTAQAILNDTQAIRSDLDTILKLAEATALPQNGEEASFLTTVTAMLGMIVSGIDQNQRSLAALHQRLEEPGIAMVLRRAMEAD